MSDQELENLIKWVKDSRDLEQTREIRGGSERSEQVGALDTWHMIIHKLQELKASEQAA